MSATPGAHTPHRLLRLRMALVRRPLLVGAIAGLAVAWPVASPPPLWWMVSASAAATTLAAAELHRARDAPGRRLVAALATLVLLGLAMAQRPRDPLAGLTFLIAATVALRSLWLAAPPAAATRARSLLAPAALGLAVLLLPEQRGLPLWPPTVAILALGLPGARAALRRPPADSPALVQALLASPARLLVASFTVLCAGGTALLPLPPATTVPGSIPLVDAAFTAVSAACVTGLAVLDTPRDFTPVGQAVILLLIQLGGLGIMTFAAAGSVALGRRLGLREEAAAAAMMGGASTRGDLERALRTVLRVTFWSEGVGAVLLTALFLGHGDAPHTAAWRGLYTSISAFCNAGFALQSDSLVSYASSPAVLVVIGALIVLGGLGPAVVVALPALSRRGHVGLHARLVVAATAALLVGPALAFLVFEWRHTLGAMPLTDKLANALFQSITLRTAGFNSIDFAAVAPATWVLALACMFIGGSPGSTAGGIKTTTIAVMLLAVGAAIRGRAEAEVYGRRIPHRTVYEAAAITAMGALSAIAALVALLLTQRLPIEQAAFEVISALGTVGLSMGATAQLDVVGKVIVAACMFAGRVGPLSLFIFFTEQRQAVRRYPLEPIQVG